MLDPLFDPAPSARACMNRRTALDTGDRLDEDDADAGTGGAPDARAGIGTPARGGATVSRALLAAPAPPVESARRATAGTGGPAPGPGMSGIEVRDVARRTPVGETPVGETPVVGAPEPDARAAPGVGADGAADVVSDEAPYDSFEGALPAHRRTPGRASAPRTAARPDTDRPDTDWPGADWRDTD